MIDHLLRWLVLLAALTQITVPVFINPFRGGENPVRAADPSQIEPAGYAFAIWGPIYVLALAYATWQVTPAGRADPVTARIAPLALILYVGSSLWLVAAQHGPLWATMPILAVMAACATVSLIVAANAEGGTGWRLWAAVVPFALYAGWTACATFVNIAEVAPQYGFDRFGLSVPHYAVLSIAAATTLAVLVLWLTRGQPVLAATVVWAFVAVIVAAREQGADPSVVVAAAAGIAVVVAVAAALRFASAGATRRSS
jgi:hypothetical protein